MNLRNTVVFILIASLFTTGCHVLSPLKLEDDDVMEITIDNSSIENYESRDYCSRTIGSIKNKKLVNLLRRTHLANIELGAGSTYFDIYIYDGPNGELKSHQVIDMGTPHRLGDKLVALIWEECEPKEEE